MKISKRPSGSVWLGKNDSLKIAARLHNVTPDNDIDKDAEHCAQTIKRRIKNLSPELRLMFISKIINKVA